MGTFVLYAIEWAIIQLALYAIYKLCFADCTFHRFNRAYLIGSIFISAILPLIGTDGLPSGTGSMSIENSDLAKAFTSQSEPEDAIMLQGVEVTAHKTSANDIIATTVTVIYSTYIIILLTGWTRSVFKMRKFLKGKKSHRLGHLVRIFTHDEHLTPFSWINNIVISQDEEKFCQYASLRHELSHIRLMHFADLTMLLLCTIVNPTCWLILKEIKIVHEYEADNEVINHYHIVSRDYQKLLIMRTVGAEAYALASSFNFEIKKRIIMMKKQKTTNVRMLWILAVIPIAGFAMTIFAKPVKTVTKTVADQTVEEQQLASSNNVVVKIDKNGQISCSSTRKSLKNISAEELASTVKSLSSSPDEIIFVIVEESAPKEVFQKVKEQLRSANRLKINYKTFKEENVQKTDITKDEPTDIQTAAIGNKKQKTDSEKHSTDNLVQKITEPENEKLSFKGSTFSILLANNEKPGSDIEVVYKGNEFQAIKKATVIGESVLLTLENSNLVEDEITIYIDEIPEYPGGMSALMDYLRQSLTYPKEAISNNIQGRVIVEFTVKEDGSLEDFKIVRSLSEECDAEAIRCIKGMPKWKPGKQRGQAVKVKFSIPIMFRIH